MLIDSDFKDYYDVGSQHGVDKTVVYLRKTVAEEINNSDPATGKFARLELPHKEHFGTTNVIKFIVGFCGKLYPVVHVENYSVGINQFLYDADECVEFLTKIKLGLGKNRSRYSIYERPDFQISSERNVRSFYSYNWSHLEKYFLERKTPIFKIGQGIAVGFRDYANIFVNSPYLREIKFAKVKDPITAYQEIYSYISGFLGTPCMPMIEIADKYKQQQHGHDHKYSFRREPSKKK